MNEELNFTERYDDLLDIKPSYGYKRKLNKIKYNYVGLEIEIAVDFNRDRYSFIRTLLKKIKSAVGENGYFVKDGTILGDYSFEIVLDPMSIKKVGIIYKKIMDIVKFSDGSICFDKKHNCGLHMNFNQYDIDDIDAAHKRLLLLMNQKDKYFEENIYKRIIYNFDFNDYLNFQKEIGDKYMAVNYLDKKLVEVRNIKTGLSSKEMKMIMCDIINALFPEKTVEVKECKQSKSLMKVLGKTFENANKKELKKSFENNLLIIKLGKKGASIVVPTDEIKKVVEKNEK
ncbi:MAG: hypothetical protein IJB82_00980 [Bacilli bacterium]|nr:hypothetical protein [Bacilli bacterium]